MIVVMLMGLTVVSATTALATRFLTKTDTLVGHMEEQKDIMNSMLMHYEVPWELQRSVISVFPSVLHNENERNFKKIIAALPVFVSEKVERFLRTKQLKLMPQFRNVKNEEALLALASVLENTFYPAGVNLFNLDTAEICEDSFFVVVGVVEVVVFGNEGNDEEEATPDKVIARLGTGAYFGGVSKVQELGGAIYTCSACQLLVLRRDDLVALMKDFSNDLGHIFSQK